MKLKSKVLLLSIVPVLVTILIVLAITFNQKGQVQISVGEEVPAIAKVLS